MKKVLAAMILVCAASSARASMVYNDPQGDVFTGAGGGILDILSLEVTNDASVIAFKFTLAGDVVATDWGKYMVIIDDAAGGDTGGNGWARPISMTTGADHWVGSWVDSGNGAELYKYTGSWGLTEATYNAPPNNDISLSKSGNTVTITTLLSNLGVSAGQTIFLDAFTSGGGGTDGAVDSVGNPNQQIADWGNPSEAHPVSYTIKSIPEPSTLALLGMGALALIRRKR
jgi:hypothetical protein